jgi:hypothetical protein
VFVPGAMYWLLSLRDHLGNDARIYRGAAAALLAGSDPWAASVDGVHFAAPPASAIAFVPSLVLPETAFVAVWLGLSVVGAVALIRTLELPATWILFPPLVQGVLLGNPAIVGLAFAIAGHGVIAGALRIHVVVPLAALGRWRDVFWSGVLFVGGAHCFCLNTPVTLLPYPSAQPQSPDPPSPPMERPPCGCSWRVGWRLWRFATAKGRDGWRCPPCFHHWGGTD